MVRSYPFAASPALIPLAVQGFVMPTKGSSVVGRCGTGSQANATGRPRNNTSQDGTAASGGSQKSSNGQGGAHSCPNRGSTPPPKCSTSTANLPAMGAASSAVGAYSRALAGHSSRPSHGMGTLRVLPPARVAHVPRQPMAAAFRPPPVCTSAWCAPARVRTTSL